MKKKAAKRAGIALDDHLLCELKQGLTAIDSLSETACWGLVESNGYIMTAADIARHLLARIEKLEGAKS